MKKLTLDALAEMCPMLDVQEQLQIIGGGDGSHDNPHTESEANFLIDNGTFKGGYVKEKDGFVSYWLGVSIVYGSASFSSSDNGFYNFNSDFGADEYWDDWGSYSGYFNASFWESWGRSTSEVGLNVENFTVPHSEELESTIGTTETIGHSLEKNAGKTRFGSDGKFRFETRTGRVFYGNQYVATTSLAGIGEMIGKYAGRANLGITVYNVAATWNNEGVEAAGKEAAKAAGGYAGGYAGVYAGGWLGLKVGTAIGTAVCPGAGSAAGAIVGTVAGILLGVGGSLAGSYIVEIGIDSLE